MQREEYRKYERIDYNGKPILLRQPSGYNSLTPLPPHPPQHVETLYFSWEGEDSWAVLVCHQAVTRFGRLYISSPQLSPILRAGNCIIYILFCCMYSVTQHI